MTNGMIVAYARGLLYYLLMTPVTIVFSLLAIFILPLPLTWRYDIISRWSVTAVWLARWCCGVSWRLHGAENLPDRACVAASNHQSAWETLFLQSALPRNCQVLKRELLKIPFLGWGLACLHPIAIDRTAASRAMRQVLREGRSRIESGWWVLVFPEGTRVHVGERRPFAQGAAALAKSCDCPLVPVAHNAGLLWPRHSLAKRPGVIDIVFGKPIETAGRSSAEVTRDLQEWIETAISRLEQEDSA